MAELVAYAGQITLPSGTTTGTYTESVSGFGNYIPKVIFFLSCNNTTGSTTIKDNAQSTFGVGCDDGTNYCMGGNAEHGVSQSDTARYHSGEYCAMKCVAGLGVGNTEMAVKVVDTGNWSAGQFKYQVANNNNASLEKLPYLALGGSGWTYKAGDFSLNTSTGNTDFDTGWPTEDVIMSTAFLSSAISGTSNGSTELYWSTGFHGSNGGQRVITGAANNGTTTNMALKAAHTDYMIEQLNAVSGLVGSMKFVRSLSTTDGDSVNGFRVNTDNNFSIAGKTFYVAFKGLKIDVGSINTTTVSGSIITASGLQGRPEAIIFTHAGLVAYGSTDPNIANAIGFGDSGLRGNTVHISVSKFRDSADLTKAGTGYQTRALSRWHGSLASSGKLNYVGNIIMNEVGTNYFKVEEDDGWDFVKPINYMSFAAGDPGVQLVDRPPLLGHKLINGTLVS